MRMFLYDFTYQLFIKNILLLDQIMISLLSNFEFKIREFDKKKKKKHRKIFTLKNEDKSLCVL